MKKILEWKEFTDPWEIKDEDIHLSKRQVRNIIHDIAEKYYPRKNVFGTPQYIKELREQMIKIWPVELSNLSSYYIHHDINDPILRKMVDEIKDKFEIISKCRITYKIKIVEHEYSGNAKEKSFKFDVIEVIFTFYVPEEEKEIEDWED